MWKQFSVTFALICPLAQASALEWGELKAMGSACRSTEVRLRGNDQSLHFDFGSFRAHGEQARETCLLALPVEWPKGKALVLKNVRYHGKNRGDSSRLAVEFHSPGRRGTPLSVIPGKGAFEESKPGEFFRSSCEGKAMLRVNSSLTVERADLSIKSLEAEASLESCQ